MNSTVRHRRFFPLLGFIYSCYAIRVVAQTGNEQWDGRFFTEIIGSSESISASVTNSDGEVIVTGNFTSMGRFPGTKGIARWTGNVWASIGGGLTAGGHISAVTLRSNDLFVGGSFGTVGGVPATNIARWDGTNWSPVGGGILGDAVRALAFYGDELVAAGKFTNAGGTAVSNIASWDGTSWRSLGPGILHGGSLVPVSALTVAGSNLIVGGSLTNAGGITVRNIAKWDGTTWGGLFAGTNLGVNAAVLALIGTDAGDVYAGGQFTNAGGVAAGFVARWDGSQWLPLAEGLSAPSQGAVRSLLLVSNVLYAGGSFWSAGTNAATGVAAWDGSTWTSLQGALSFASTLVASNGKIFASGYVANSVNGAGSGIARFDGSSWTLLGQGISDLHWSDQRPRVTSFAFESTNAYVAGIFTRFGLRAPGLPALIGNWLGDSWSDLAEGIDPDRWYAGGQVVKAIGSVGSNLYVAGTFLGAGTNSAPNIARWDGQSWNPVGSNLPSGALSLALRGGEVYAGGSFGITSWDGATWSPVGFGVEGTVAALAAMGTNIFAAGSFSMAGGAPAINIARWNGSAWCGVGDGLAGSVNALAVHNNILYAGGVLSTTGGVVATTVARWEGTNWQTLGSEFDNLVAPLRSAQIYALDVDERGNLYAGGRFTNTGGSNVNYVARWNGSNWTSLGTGVNNEVTALKSRPGSVIVGGMFTQAGAKPSHRIGLWHDPSASVWVAARPPPVFVSNSVILCRVVFGTVGTNPVTNATIRLPLPPGATFLSASDGGSVVDNAVVWMIPVVPAGTGEYELQVSLSIGAAPPLLFFTNYWIEAPLPGRAYGRAAFSTPEPGNTAPLVAITNPVSGSAFTAPATIEMDALVTDPDGIAEVRFYSETNLVAIRTNPPYSVVLSNIGAGTYGLRAVARDTLGAERISWPVYVSVIVRPPNDQFTNRVVMAGPSVTNFGDNINATTEPGEPSHFSGVFYGGPVSSVWWTWTAPASGDVHLSTDGSSFATTAAVYTGDSVSNLTGVANNVCTSCRAEFDFFALAGTNYQIAIDGYGGGQGTIQLSLDLNQRPQASIISPTNGTTWTGTRNLDLLADAIDPDGFIQRVDFFMNGNLSSMDTSFPYTQTFPNLAGGSHTFTVRAYDDRGASVTSSPVTVTAYSTNDAFANRIHTTGYAFVYYGANFAATVEPGEPFHSGDSAGHSVWWEWTAPATARFALTAEGLDDIAGLFPVVGVYTGSSVSDLTLVAIDRGFLSSTVTFDAVLGQKYLVVVDSNHSSIGYDTVGRFRLSLTTEAFNDIRLVPIGPAPTDLFELRLDGFPGLTGTLEASSNFTQWVPLTTNFLLNSNTILFDTNFPSIQRRFYRFIPQQ